MEKQKGADICPFHHNPTMVKKVWSYKSQLETIRNLLTLKKNNRFKYSKNFEVKILALF